MEELEKAIVVTRRIPIDRKTDLLMLLRTIGYVRGFIDEDVVRSVPESDADEGDVFLFNPALVDGGDGLEGKYRALHAKPDPRALVSLNWIDPEFAHEFPLHATFWQNPEGILCYVAFDTVSGRTSVLVDSDVNGKEWAKGWLIGGVRVK